LICPRLSGWIQMLPRLKWQNWHSQCFRGNIILEWNIEKSSKACHISLEKLADSQDFVLAFICGFECGISLIGILEWVSSWKPSKWLGEMSKTVTRRYFAGGHNANLPAFLNSLSQFDRFVLQDNRLLVPWGIKKSGLA
jgi:hypothetical protein